MLAGEARIIVISSVSGGGKTTLIRELREKYPQLHCAVTATSRLPREGEVDGMHYYFYSPDLFRKLIQEDGLLEHAVVHGNYYGVPAAPLWKRLEEGTSVILNIDVQGMESVRKKLGDRMFSIFLLPPSDLVWEERLRNRSTDSEEVIRHRLENGREELKFADRYDYRIVNDSLKRAVDEISAILKKEGVLPA